MQTTVLAEFSGAELTLSELRRSPHLHQGLVALIREQAIRRVIAEEGARLGLEPAVEDLQSEADGYRASLGLHRAEDTNQWLQQHGLTIDDLEREAQERWLFKKVRDQVVGAKVEVHFHENKTGFDEVILARLVVSDEGLARELLLQVEEGEQTFESLVSAHTQEEQNRYNGGRLGAIRRGQLRPEVESAVFGARSGQVLGPFEEGKTWRLFKVIALQPASLSPALRDSIAAQLFQQHLESRLRDHLALKI